MPFQKIIRSSIVIKATPAQVWQTLMDFQQYDQWSTFIHSITGEAAIGQSLQVDLAGMRFKPRVLVYETHKHFAWRGHLGLPGLFDGTHHFELEALTKDDCRLIHREEFSGWFLPLLGNTLKKLPQQFDSFNKALKVRVEKS